MRAGRKRKVRVDRSGRGRRNDHEARERAIYAETLLRRGRELQSQGINPSNAVDPLSGFTLGKLLLRQRASEGDPSGISQAQYDAGQAWCRLVHRHAAIMGYKLHIHTPQFVAVPSGTGSGADPGDQEIASVRRSWSNCYNALMDAVKSHGMRVPVVTYGVCIENWPLDWLSGDDFGKLRTGLNAVGRVL